MKKVITHLSGSVCYAICQWLIIVLITKKYGVIESGLYAYYLGLITPFTIFLNAGLRIFIATDVKSQFSDQSYLSLRFISVFVFFVSTLPWVSFVENKDIYIFCCLIKGLDSLSELEYGAWNRSRTIIFYSISQVLKLLSLLLCFVFVQIHIFEMQDVLILYPCFLLFSYMFFDRRRSSLKMGFSSLDEVLGLYLKAMPLMFSALLGAAVIMVNRLVADFFFGPATLAMYVYLIYFYSVASMFVLSISQVSIPNFAKSNFPFSTKTFYRMTFVIGIFSLIFVCFVMFYSNFFAKVFYSEEVYFEFSHRFWVGVGSIANFFSVFINSLIISKGYLKQVGTINLKNLAFNLCSIVFCVSIWAESGLYVSFALSGLFVLFLNSFYSIKLLRGLGSNG